MSRLLLFALLTCTVVPVCGDEPAKLLEARKIWDQAPHNAFTDLVRFQDRWFCVFREGKGHVSPDGALRVITSTDGDKWESAALITSPDSDLRDAKITITPDGQLMLAGAEALHDKSKKTHQSLAWFSKDGRTWSDKHDIGDPDFWLWRVTWHKGRAYGIGYGCGKDQSVRLYSSSDGKTFDTLVERLFDVGYPNETSLVFDGDTCYCLLRRDGKPNNGLLGTSQPPYTRWEWQDLGQRIGGPHMLKLPDGRFVAAVRLFGGGVHTGLAWVEPQEGKFTEFLKLPSGGDTSYAGLVWHDGLLWVSYYSSHEGKTNIYLAKVQIPPQPAKPGEGVGAGAPTSKPGVRTSNRELLRLDPATRERCREILRMGMHSDEFWPAVHAAEGLTLAGGGTEVVATLQKRLSGERDEQRRCGLARELVRAGDRGSLPILFEILADRRSSGRVHAAESLYKLGEAGDGKLLRAAYAEENQPQLQNFSAAALARSGDREALTWLRARLRSDDRAIRNTAAFALARLGGEADIEPLQKALERETDLTARAYLVCALACLGNADGREELGRNLSADDTSVRTVSAEFAGHSGCSEHQAGLIRLLDDTTLDTRVRAAQSLIALSLPAVPR